MNKHRELLTSIRRYYSNAFTDRAKQDAINLFLGYFVPDSTRTPLWELDTDYYLHNFHVQNAGLQSMREYKKDQYFLDQDEVYIQKSLVFVKTRVSIPPRTFLEVHAVIPVQAVGLRFSCTLITHVRCA